MNINIVTKEEWDELKQLIVKLISSFEELNLETRSSLLFTNEQLAIKLEVSKKTLQNWRDKGLIGFTKIGRKIFYTQDQIVDFLNSKTFKKFQ